MSVTVLAKKIPFKLTAAMLLYCSIIPSLVFAATNSYTALQPPVPSITANGYSTPISITQNSPLSVKISLATGGNSGQNADWWIVTDTPTGVYSYVYPTGWTQGLRSAYQGPLFDLTPEVELPNITSPTGDSTFYFGIDLIPNGEVDISSLAYASVKVTITDATSTEKPFTIVVYPDSQNETDNGPDKAAVWQTQNQWVVNNKTDMNIVAVLGVGDVVNRPSDTAYTTAIVKGYNLVADAGIPYLPMMGNHDFPNYYVAGRDSSKYDQYFGPARYAGKTWYLGGYPANSNANMVIAFEAGTRKFLVIGLEPVPRIAAVAWAQSIINANPGREIIIVTHAYLQNDGTLYPGNDQGLDPNTNYSGQKLWDEFIKINSSIFMVLGGHDICSPTEAHLVSKGLNNNNVNQIFTNHQCFPDDGSILILQFKPSSGVIEATPYSTVRNANDPAAAPYTLAYQ